jgi:Flp pilus assembly protein TadD
VFASLVDHYPDDLGAKNNLASTLLLLNTQLEKANQYAQEAYEKSPKTAAFATTYAYSLHLHGRTADGLKVLRALPESDLQKPGIAVYYGVLLSAAGEGEQAKKYFAIAATDKNLLPEEAALMPSTR